MGRRKEYANSFPSCSQPPLNPGPNEPPAPEDRLKLNDTKVRFPAVGSACSRKGYDFARWYGIGIDAITHACQTQIERFIRGLDGDRSTATIIAYCENGINLLLNYCALIADRTGATVGLHEVDRGLIDGLLNHLKDTGTKVNAQRSRYKNAKAVLVALGKRNIITIVEHGEHSTFPLNPFPGSNRKYVGEKPLTIAQRKAFNRAVKTALMPLYQEGAEATSELLAYAVLSIALHTGRNTTGLLDLSVDCLRPHPKDNVQFLIAPKRRSIREQGVPISVSPTSATTVWRGVAYLIERIKECTAKYRPDADDHLKDHLLIYRPRVASKGITSRSIVPLTDSTLRVAVCKLVEDHNLTDSSGQPLRINVSILRKTFANRMFELTDGNLAATAAATGHSPSVSERHYMTPGEDAEKHWLFMGRTMHQELLNNRLGETEKTPSGHCSDLKYGQHAPKNGATCMRFLSCLHCRNYVVTGDDLYRLFSLYWLVVRERDRVDKRKWKRNYGHIVRLIDKDIVNKGVSDGTFHPDKVTAAREEARANPHPFWASADTLEVLE